MIDLGKQTTRSLNLTNSAGVAVDADSTPTWAVTLPGLTAGISPSVQHGTAGEYYVAYPTVATGLHRDVWTAIVAGQTVTVRDVFTVEDATAPAMVSVAEALAHLKANSLITSAPDLEYLRWLCLVASEAVESDLGATIVPTVVTETYSGCRRWDLPLRSVPVISITTVVENGITLTTNDYFLDPDGWILCRGTTLAQRPWMYGRANIVVTEVAGYTNPPRVARKVCLNGIQRMWQGSQQMPHPSLDDIGAEIVAATGVLTPLELAAYRSLTPAAIA